METLNSEDSAVISDLREQVKRLETKFMNLENHGKADNRFFRETHPSRVGTQLPAAGRGLEDSMRW